jgi:NADH-quinone oxidoreductase subunit B
MKGLLLLQEAVGRERRPLSWVVGPQDVQRPVMPCQRELRREERVRQTLLRPPDGVT